MRFLPCAGDATNFKQIARAAAALEYRRTADVMENLFFAISSSMADSFENAGGENAASKTVFSRSY